MSDLGTSRARIKSEKLSRGQESKVKVTKELLA